MCAGCREELARTLAKSQSGAALGKAFLMGGAAALGCGVAYAIFEAVVHFQLAIITIGIAIVIATVIRKASGGISGLRFQILAVALTYFASAMGYAPAVWKGLTSAESHHAATSDASVHPVGSPAASAHADAHAGADAHAAAAPNANPDAKTPFSPFKFLLAIALFVAFTLAAPVLHHHRSPHRRPHHRDRALAGVATLARSSHPHRRAVPRRSAGPGTHALPRRRMNAAVTRLHRVQRRGRAGARGLPGLRPATARQGAHPARRGGECSREIRRPDHRARVVEARDGASSAEQPSARDDQDADASAQQRHRWAGRAFLRCWSKGRAGLESSRLRKARLEGWESREWPRRDRRCSLESKDGS